MGTGVQTRLEIDTDGTGKNILTVLLDGSFANFTSTAEANDLLITVACYAKGTRILTDAGPRNVESLAIGDRVRTAFGELRSIKWIGHRHVDCRRHPDPRQVWPVRVRARAFDDAVPHRDLWLSPDHAVFVDEVLIPVRQLINGATIAQVEAGQITYFHVELEQHDVLLAEGLPAESYLDTGNRAMFENVGVRMALHPDFSGGNQETRAKDACAPLVVRADQVEPIWRRLAARAVASSQPISLANAATNSRLRLSAGGHEIKPVLVTNDRYVCALPPQTDMVQIISRAAAPSDFRPWLDDRRRLGVSVGRIILRNEVELTEIPVDHPSLVNGWHDVERDGTRQWRWTDGCARVPVPKGVHMIEIHFAFADDYPVSSTTEGCPIAA